jgi:TonB family protein
MNRLQKKCFLAAAGFHLLLVTILIIGPAFLSSKSEPVDVPLIDFVPVKTVDALVSGGGNPKAQSPPPMQTAPPQPVVTPPAPQPQEKEPAPKLAPKEIERPKVSESLEADTKPKSRKPKISTTLVSRETTSSRARASEEAKRAADARRRAAEQISKAAAGIASGLSGSTEIELKGPGGGGVPYANFLQAVKKCYSDAWIVPDGITDDTATVTASVTIARDGKVISARIIRRSGNAAVDQSVQMTLDRVTIAAPLPDDAKEDQRTVTIDFNLKAKLIG